VSDTDAFVGALHDVAEEHGRIDVLINNAAVEWETPVTDSAAGLDSYRELFETNVFGVIAGTLAVLPGMVARGSGIVANLSSDSAATGSRSTPPGCHRSRQSRGPCSRTPTNAACAASRTPDHQTVGRSDGYR